MDRWKNFNMGELFAISRCLNSIKYSMEEDDDCPKASEYKLICNLAKEVNSMFRERYQGEDNENH